MSFNEELIKELEQESKSTRKILERIPVDTWDWKPHEKSMSMKTLALLVAQMFGWPPKMARTAELDFENAEGWFSDVKTTEELVAELDKNVADLRETLAKTDEATMNENWVMRKGETILWDVPRKEAIRNTISHMAHHRGQLSVFLRLKDIDVPSIYGPTADDSSFEM
jgi:uncharacterized damage-inducible protein DinB